MTNQDELISIILKSKCTVGNWATAMNNKSKYGSNIDCCQKNMLLLSEYITIAEFYNCYNFEDNGNVTTPDRTCLTLAQVTELTAKMKALIKCQC